MKGERNSGLKDSERLAKGRATMEQLYDGGEDGRRWLEEVFPDFRKLIQKHLYGDIWSRPGLKLQDRIIVDLVSLIVTKHNEGLADAMRAALRNGVTREEILETILHAGHYGGLAAGLNAARVAKEVFPPIKGSQTSDKSRSEDVDMTQLQHREVGESIMRGNRGFNFSPNELKDFFTDFDDMIHEYNYGEIWSRPGLTRRQRSMINIAVLMWYRWEWTSSQSMRTAMRNGVTQEEILEIIMHVVHYYGWPAGIFSLFVARSVFEDPYGSTHLPLEKKI